MKRHGWPKIIGFYNLFTPSLLVADLDIARHLMIKDMDNFGDHIKISSLKTQLGDSVFTVPYSLWKAQRAIGNACFTMAKLKGMQPLMEECIKDLADNMTGHAGNIVNVQPLLNAFALDVITTCGFSTRVTLEPVNAFRSSLILPYNYAVKQLKRCA